MHTKSHKELPMLVTPSNALQDDTWLPKRKTHATPQTDGIETCNQTEEKTAVSVDRKSRKPDSPLVVGRDFHKESKTEIDRRKVRFVCICRAENRNEHRPETRTADRRKILFQKKRKRAMLTPRETTTVFSLQNGASQTYYTQTADKMFFLFSPAFFFRVFSWYTEAGLINTVAAQRGSGLAVGPHTTFEKSLNSSCHSPRKVLLAIGSLCLTEALSWALATSLNITPSLPAICQCLLPTCAS